MEAPATFMEQPAIFVERTLAIIKPDAIDQSAAILRFIEDHGFAILQQRRLHMTPEQCSDFYAEHYGKMFFPSLVSFMSSGPIIAMVLAKENCILEWRDLLGPTSSHRARETHPESLRAIYGTDDQRNAVHGSDSQKGAEREIRFFFADAVVEPISSGDQATDYLVKNVMPVLTNGFVELCKVKPEDPLTWIADWLMANNPNKPQVQEPVA